MIYILALISISIGALGQFLLKLGANQMKAEGALLTSILSMINNAYILIAAPCFVLSMVMWVFVLRKIELSIAYPMVSLGYVIVLILSYFLLKEPMYLSKVIGSILIIVGVISLNIK